MKILFVTHGYPPHARGGAEISTALIAEEIVKHHTVCVITPKFQTQTWTRKGIKIHPIMERFDQRTLTFKGAIKYGLQLFRGQQKNARLLSKFVKENDIDLIHIVPSGTPYVSLTRAALRTGKPVVIDVRDYALICPASYLTRGTATHCPPTHLQCLTRRYRARGLIRLGLPLFAMYELSLFLWNRAALKRDIKKYNAKFVAVSDFVKNELINAGYPNSKICVIRNIAKPSVKVKKRINRMMFAGQIEKSKGIFDAVEAFSKINDKTMTFEIAGAGNEEENLRQLIKIFPRIKFIGKITNEQVHEKYRTSRIIIGPSIWPEPFGRYILESIATTTPLITTKTGGTTEAVKNKINGMIVSPERPDELAKAIDELCENQTLYNRIVSELKVMQHDYSAEIIAKKRMEVYDKLIGGQ